MNAKCDAMSIMTGDQKFEVRWKMSIYAKTFRISFALLVLILTRSATFAASPSVTAVLSSSQPAVGQMVQLEIKVNGANSANVPETISIDGLEIHQTGTSRQFEMHNFDVSSSVTYNYTVLPLKAGHFKIPAQTVRVGNDSLRTPELVLNVAQGSSSSGSAAGSAQSGQSTVASKLAFAELVVAKKDAYRKFDWGSIRAHIASFRRDRNFPARVLRRKSCNNRARIWKQSAAELTKFIPLRPPLPPRGPGNLKSDR